MRSRSLLDALLCPMLGPMTAAVLALALTACQREPSTPVANVSAAPTEVTLPHGVTTPVTVTWELQGELGDGVQQPTVFVHLVDAEGQIRMTVDHPFPHPWQSGATLTDPVRLYHSAFAPPLPAGTYQLTLGLFEGDRRWPLNAGPEVARREYQVATVTVPASAGAGPAYAFSPAWTAAAPGEDRQVLARRWLSETGTINVTGLTPGGSLWLAFHVPKPSGRQRLVIAEGSDAANVELTLDCVPAAVDTETAADADTLSTPVYSQTFTDPGNHEATIPIQTDVEGCELTFRPTFHLIDVETFQKSALALEQLAWEPAAG